MMKVKKRSELREDFDRRKLEKSMQKAGADATSARLIAESIQKRDGIPTSELRKHVVQKLTAKNSKFGHNYDTFKKPAAVKK